MLQQCFIAQADLRVQKQEADDGMSDSVCFPVGPNFSVAPLPDLSNCFSDCSVMYNLISNGSSG